MLICYTKQRQKRVDVRFVLVAQLPTQPVKMSTKRGARKAKHALICYTKTAWKGCGCLLYAGGVVAHAAGKNEYKKEGQGRPSTC